MSWDASLEITPTWAVALVCTVLIASALAIEHALHLITTFFERRRRRTINQAIYHIKAELRNLGFMSLSLTFAKNPISRICVPRSWADSLLPCKMTKDPFSFEDQSCLNKGKVSLLSTLGMGQLQLLIFLLAVFHVLSCLVTFLLGDLKINRWKSWEEETKTLEYQLSNDPRRFQLTRSTSFGKRHLKLWSDHRWLLWLACFFRQFSKSVSKADYYALRHGFLTVHFGKDCEFDFHKFLRRSLDHDFAVVVKISIWIWIYAILFIFFNARAFYNRYWSTYIPLMILFIVGMKLGVIITTMCLKSGHEAVIISGTVSVKPDNDLFWFNQPQLLLHIIQFIIIQNSFHLTFLTWSWYTFGLKSCFHRDIADNITTIGIGMLVQFLCAYVTLPLYALVSQMGTSPKQSIFADHIIEGLKNWHRSAKQSLEERKSSLSSRSTERSRSVTTEDTSGSIRSMSGVQEFKYSAATEDTSGSIRSMARVQEFKYPSGRLELLEVQRVVEEIIQGGGNSPHNGDMSFRLWRTQGRE